MGKKRSRSIICTQNAFFCWKYCKNRSSGSWDNFCPKNHLKRDKKRIKKEINASKIYSLLASLLNNENPEYVVLSQNECITSDKTDEAGRIRALTANQILPSLDGKDRQTDRRTPDRRFTLTAVDDYRYIRYIRITNSAGLLLTIQLSLLVSTTGTQLICSGQHHGTRCLSGRLLAAVFRITTAIKVLSLSGRHVGRVNGTKVSW